MTSSKRNKWILGVAAVFALSMTNSASAAEKKAGKHPAAAVPVAQAPAATPEETDPLEVVRAELRAGKTAVIAELMQFKSDEDAVKFWPIYRHFQADLADINDRRLAIVDDYLAAYRDLTDEEASKIMKRVLAVQLELVKLRERYSEILSKELSPVVAASFLQIEGLLEAVMSLEVKSNLPLLAEKIRDGSAINVSQAQK